MGSGDLEKIKAVAQSVLGKLSKGKECKEEATVFTKSGALVPDQLVEATFGNRRQNVKPCPETLRVFLEAGANVNGKDSLTQGPLIHRACWEGSLDVVKMLIEFRADLEAQEERMKTPSLNTALAGGNATVAMELLHRNASVDWKHQDGATPLHVAVGWIASTHNAEMRKPPLGEEPCQVIALMLQNGVDPTVTEGMTKSETRGQGMTPLESFRREIQRSPWRSDPEVGPKFDQVAGKVHKMLEQGETAVKRKNEGNQAFKVSKYGDALKLYAEARKIWEASGVSGHHVAVLYSNEAACYKKGSEWEKCEQACTAGLSQFCSSKIKKKLEDLKKEAIEESAAEARGEVKEVAPPAPRAPPSKLEGGFLAPETAPDKELYPEPSVQGGTGKSPGPFICGFNDAMHAGFVDGCDGDKDKQKKEELALDKQLVAEGLLDPEFLTTSDQMDLINGPKRHELEGEKAEIEYLKAQRERAKARARKQLQDAIKSGDKDELTKAIDNAKKKMVSTDDELRKKAQALLEAAPPMQDGDA
jgi:hypothetical protein